MTRLETLIKDISDPSVAEALKLLGESPTPGGSGEPADSIDEVATGKRDANGRMIYKKTYIGANAPSNNIIDSTVNQDIIELYDVKGRITDASGGSNTFCSNFGSGYNCNGVKINENGIYVDFGSYFKSGYYVTIYYTYKSEN